MDETPKDETPTKSKPTIELPAAIKWHCDQCKRWVRTVPDGTKFIVPHCRTCRARGKGGFVSDGILMYEIDGEVQLIEEMPRHREGLDRAMWKQFCALLDTAQARMADGSMSRTYCRACEEAPHTSTNACPCQCHKAWAFRRAVEAQMEKAA